MKVLLVGNSDWGLFNFRLGLARSLRERGAEVVLVCPEGPYVDRLRAAGFRTLRWNLKRGSVSPFSEMSSVLHLLRIYRRESPRLVHHFTIKPNVYGVLAARLARVPAVVNTWTGLGYVFADSSKASVLRPMIVTILRLLNGDRRIWNVFQNQENLQAMVGRRCVSPDRTSLIAGSGVDTTLFRPRQAEPTSPVPTVLMAARILRDKGVLEFASAAKLLVESGVKARFMLAGSIDPGNPASLSEGELDGLVRATPLELLGHRDDMSDLLASVDVAVLPSYHEGLPRFLLEAAAVGLPLVATDVPGCRAIARPGVNAMLVPPRDSLALASAIEVLVNDPGLRRQLGRSGRALVVAEYGEDRISMEYLALYERVADFPMLQGQAQRINSSTSNSDHS